MLDKEKFWDDHIPYRISILKAGIKTYKESNDINVGIRNACFVGCAITVRQLINFFGIDVENKQTCPNLKVFQKGKYNSDVLIKDIDGEMISINDLNPSEKKMLINAFLTGDRAAAHLTDYSSKGSYGGDSDVVIEAAEFLLEQLRIKLYKIIDKEMPDSWRPS